MCLMIEKHIEPSIAEEDITVYKVVCPSDGVIYSWFYSSHIWILGEEQQTDIIVVDETCNFDEKEEVDYEGVENVKYIGPGFHSAGTIERFDDINSNNVIMECIIPKGALYYHNLSDLYVSNRLIPVKLMRKR
jgi:hypothetical protein